MLRKALEQSDAKVFPYIPDRHADGFGFHANSISGLKEKDVGLIITVDCGIANNEGVSAAEDAGIDVIITDHHEAPGELPKAFAILNPMQPDCGYPFKGLCGAGVVFKLVQALQQKSVLRLPEGQEKWLLDLVAVATIADMVPLTGENRIFANFGLKVLQKTRRLGLRALLDALRLGNGNGVSEDDVSFSIAPRINAASRMGEARLAYDLLATENEKEAIALAHELEQVNNSRKGVVASIIKEAHSRIEEGNLAEKEILVLGSTHWRPSLLGLVATNLVEKYNVPVFLWGEDGSGEIRGSCRGNGTVSMHELMKATNGNFLQFGGHREAGGFTVVKEKIHHLADVLIKAKEKLLSKDKESGSADAVISLTDINNHFLKSLFSLRPFGLANEKPLFHFPKTWADESKMFGKNSEHLEIIFSQGNSRARAIKFFAGDSFKNRADGGSIDIFGHIEEDPFRGRDAWRVRIVEIK